MSEKNKTILISVLLGTTTIFMGVSFFAWTLIPHLQMAEYLKNMQTAPSEHNLQVLLSTFNSQSFMFEPETYVQGYIREIFLTNMFDQYKAGAFSNTKLYPLFDLALQKNIEYVQHHPEFYEYDFNIAKAYDAKYSLQKNSEFLKEAEVYYKLALSAIPNRQEVVYAYSINLLNQGRGQEAVEMLNRAMALNPEISETHYELGQAYYFMGLDTYNDSLDQFELALNNGINTAPSLTKQIYLSFFTYYYKQNDTERFTVVLKRLMNIDQTQKASYQTVLDYIQKNHEIPLVNIEN